MTITAKRKYDNQDDNIPLLSEGISQTFINERQVEAFNTANSTAITIDLGLRLFREIIEWKEYPVNFLDVQIMEVQRWERMTRRLNILNAVSGILNDLTSEQMEDFERSVKRSHLFK